MKSRLFIAAMLLAFTSLWVACSESEDAVCGDVEDCPTDQICEDGVCKLPSRVRCSGPPDCSGGEKCVDGVCRPLNDNNENNTNNTTNNANNTNNMVDMGEDFPPDSAPDNVNPEIESITPANGAEDIATDVQIEVVFNEDMNPLTVNFQSLVLKNPAGQDVAAIVNYDAATRTATLIPNAPLNQASGYRVVPLATLRDEAGNSLRVTPSPESRFYTGISEPASLRSIAEKFAPVIYQSIAKDTGADLNTDIPTTVDFDGDMKARNNKAAARVASARFAAKVYYSVVESKTHYFLTYTLYYPLRNAGGTLSEHDFTGVVFVVDKATESFKLAEGLKVETSDTRFAWKPDSSDVQGTGQPQNLENFADSGFENGRYPLYIPSGIHAACHWTKRGPTVPTGCLHNPREFSDGATQGVIMRPGAAQTYAQATVNGQGIKEITYELVPLGDLWSHRTDVDNELLWEQVSAYDPIGMRPSKYEGTMEPIVWPNRLVSDDTQTFGKPPFAWLKQSTASNQGQWIFDPAYMMTVRYDFGPTFSTDYCYNYFLGVNNRGDAAFPECPADQ